MTGTTTKMGNVMKKLLIAAALLLPVAALAQAPAGRGAAPPPSAPGATTRAADGPAVVVSAEQIIQLAQHARATYAATNPKNPNIHETIIAGTPYTLSLEHRVGKANAAQHAGNAELMIVLEGTGVFTVGGAIVNPTTTGANTSGPEIANGTSRNVAKGDMMLVPENTPHQFLPEPGGPLILATVLVPRAGAWAAPAPGGRGAGAPKLFALAADTPPIVAAARTQLPTAARFFSGGTLLSMPPYRVGLELRSPKGVASVHKNNAEFMYVIEGEGIIETGGTMVNPRDTGANIDGDSQAGSTINRMKKGDFIFVPKGVPHLARTDGHFVLATMHVPGGEP